MVSIDISGLQILYLLSFSCIWNVSLKDSRIYEILDELQMSHQKAHARLRQC